MKIRTETFCTLATSVDWQTWLYKMYPTIYREFLRKLHESRGCAENRQLMLSVLDEIEDAGGSEQLVAFLRQFQPSAIIESSVSLAAEADKYGVFPEFVPGLLTYPHRQIFTGSRVSLEQKVKKFAKDKLVCEYLVLEDVAYVEYLSRNEEALVAKIPEVNWHIRTYRKNNPRME